MQRFKYVKTISILLMITLLSTGCIPFSDPLNRSGLSNDSMSLSDINAERQKLIETEQVELQKYIKNDTLVISSMNPISFNPYENVDFSVTQLMSLMYDSLFHMNEDMKPEPVLVDTYAYSSDFLTLTLNLKQNVLFQNGEPLTAKDVVYSYNQISAYPNKNPYSKSLDKVASIQAISDFVVKITYTQPYFYGLYYLDFPIVSKAYFSDTKNYSPLKPMGTGAYSLSAYTTMQNIQLVANAHYFKGTPTLNKIYVQVVRDQNSERLAYENHVVDLLFQEQYDWSQYSEDTTQKMEEYPSNHFVYLGFNPINALVNDSALKSLVQNAVPREAMLKDIYLNHGDVIYYPALPNSWLYAGSNELIDKRLETEILPLTFNADNKYIDQDKNGYFDYKVGDVVTDFQINLLILEGNKNRLNEAKYIQQTYKEIGFKVNILSKNKLDFDAAKLSRSFDLILTESKIPNAPDFKSFYGSFGQSNVTGYTNTTMDGLMNAMESSQNEASFMNAYMDFVVFYSRELPVIPLYTLNSALIYRNFIQTPLLPCYNSILRNVPQITLSKLTK